MFKVIICIVGGYYLSIAYQAIIMTIILILNANAAQKIHESTNETKKQQNPFYYLLNLILCIAGMALGNALADLFAVPVFGE